MPAGQAPGSGAAKNPEADLLHDPLLRDVPTVEGFKVLDPAVLYARIGEGGMGAVYRGRHFKLDLDVAVKCLKPSLAAEDPDFVKRFEREARLAASIGHQNVVRVMDVHEKNGLHYLVMEFVRGETAAERVKRKGALKEKEALAILLGATAGLAEAHQLGIVHRDIKPDNIMISLEGRAKLADLGLAKSMGPADGRSVSMPQSRIMGTPQYMPPEQWDTTDVTTAADVWALGATFYYLLAGRHGISGSGTFHAIAKRIQDQDYPSLRAERPDVRPEVHALLERCVQREPKDRFPDARALLKAIRKLAEDDDEALLDPKTGSGALRAGTVTPPPRQTLLKIRAAVELAAAGGTTQPQPGGPLAAKSEGPTRVSPPQASARSRMGLLVGALGLLAAVLGVGYGAGWFTSPANVDPKDQVPPASADKQPAKQADVTPPELTVTPLPKVTKAAQVEVAGTVRGLQGGELKVAGTTITPAADGTFAVPCQLDGDQDYTIDIEARDVSGNLARRQLAVRRDTTPPVVEWTSPELDRVPAGEIEVWGTVQDASSVTVTVNGKPATMIGAVWKAKVEVAAAAAGSRLLPVTRVSVSATDEAGNVSQPLLRMLTPAREQASRIQLDGLGITMLRIEPATFRMGSPASEAGHQDDETQHTVTISKAYWMAETEVTEKQWRDVMGTQPWQGKNYTTEGDDVAATYINWTDAVAFCDKLTDRERAAGRLPEGYRYCLPTEAEWELACRGSATSTTAFCFGDPESSLAQYAVFGKPVQAGSSAETVRGNRKANAFGLYDMHGNVWEWCADFANWDGSKVITNTYRDGVTDPLCLSGSRRVGRGGGWNFEPAYCRSAFRYCFEPDNANISLGFRPALSARPPAK